MTSSKIGWPTIGARVPPEIHERLEAIAAERQAATGVKCRKAHIVAEAIDEKLDREAA